MQLLTPTLVDVRDREGRVRPALLLASRADRRFVQVNHAAGDNRLRWVEVGEVTASAPPAAAAAAPAAAAPAAPAFEPGRTAAVSLGRPRAQR